MPDPVSWSIALPWLLVALAFGYLLGSIPFGLILPRLAGLGDVRTIGSGNIGATNVLRTGHKGLAAATLIADITKGFGAVWIGLTFGPDQAIAAGLGAFLGHCFPVWLKFKGGKGVATYVGILLGFAFKAALVFGGAWIIVAALTRYSSLAALIASVAATSALFWLDNIQTGELFILLTILVWLFHRQNIARLLKGTENKIGKKS